MATTEGSSGTAEPTTTKTPTTTTLAPTLPTNETTTETNNTTVGQPTSTPTPTTEITTIASSTYGGTKTEPGSSSKAGPIVGGVVGGVAFIVIVVALLVWFRRRQRNKKPKEVKMAPGVDDLQKVEGGAAHGPIYTNIDADGSINDRTDPSIGDDGYIQKSTQKKKRKHKGKQARQNSMPLHPAPPTPLASPDGNTDTNTAGMGAYENINKGSKTTVHSKPSKPNPSSAPKAATKSTAKKTLTPANDPGYVNTRDPSLKAGAGVNTDKEYVNMEANAGHEPQTYANIEAHSVGSDHSSAVSEQLYENPAP